MITKITRSYSRSSEFKRPDGTGLWVKHESTMEATLGEGDDIQSTSKGLEEMCMADVALATREEAKKIKAAFEPKEDAPFPTSNSGTGLAARPRV